MKRRGLLKLIGALGALALPFTLWPSRVISALEKMARPNVKLEFPPEPVSIPLADPTGEALNRTALEDIEYLSSPELEGRRAGTRGEELASIYLQEQMSHLGLIPYGINKNTYVQPFTVLSYHEKVVNNRLTLRPETGEYLKSAGINLIGGIKGEKEDEFILISAHYDHLGIYKGNVYPGANDNASGVGTVLDVTRRILSDSQKPKRTVIIAFWSAEEVGFLGSKAFVKSPSVSLAKIKAVLNVDTVANGKTGDLCLWSVGEHIALNTIQSAAKPFGVNLSVVHPNGHNSDHISFAQAGIPAVTLLARDWLNKNHSPEDTLDRINPDQLKLAADIVYQAIKELAF